MSRAQTATCGHRAFLFHEGAPAERVHVVLTGQIRVLQTSAEGHQVALRVVGPGQMLGAVAALGHTSYPASARALVDSRTSSWDGKSLSCLMDKHPVIARNALAYLAGQMGELQERYRELATERVEQRIARALLRLVRHAGRRVETGVEVDMPVSRQDLAELTGTTVYTASRILSQWEANALVHSSRVRIVITAPHEIVRIAEDLAEGIPAPDAESGPAA